MSNQIGHVMIGGIKVSICLRRLETDFGMFVPQTRTIYLDVQQIESAGRSVDTILLHELCHAAFEITGLTNLISNKLEEAVCDCIGENLGNLLQVKRNRGRKS